MATGEVINQTVNATLNATVNISTAGMSFSEQLIEVYYPLLKERIIGLILAPQDNPDMLWIVFPLAISLVFMTLYFGRYKREELGWNTAFGNSLALLFVAVDLFRQIAKEPTHLELLQHGVISSKLLVPVLIFVFAIFLLLANFFHIFPKFFAFFISSALPINLLAYVGIVVVYINFPFDWITMIAASILLLMLFLFFEILKFFEPQDWEEKQQDLIDKMMHKNQQRRQGGNDEE